MQIDVKRVEKGLAICLLYTGDRCVKILMADDDYQALMRDGFFIRDGLSKDSADVINTSREYELLKRVPA